MAYGVVDFLWRNLVLLVPHLATFVALLLPQYGLIWAKIESLTQLTEEDRSEVSLSIRMCLSFTESAVFCGLNILVADGVLLGTIGALYLENRTISPVLLLLILFLFVSFHLLLIVSTSWVMLRYQTCHYSEFFESRPRSVVFGKSINISDNGLLWALRLAVFFTTVAFSLLVGNSVPDINCEATV